MSNRKNIIILCVCMALALCSCGEQTAAPSETAVSETTAAETSDTDVTAESTETESSEQTEDSTDESTDETEAVTEEETETETSAEEIMTTFIEDDAYSFSIPDVFYDIDEEDASGADYEYIAGEYRLAVNTELLADYGYSEDKDGFEQYLENFKSAAFYAADASGYSLSDEKEETVSIDGNDALKYTYVCPYGYVDDSGEYAEKDYAYISYAIYRGDRAVTVRISAPCEKEDTLKKYAGTVMDSFSFNG